MKKIHLYYNWCEEPHLFRKLISSVIRFSNASHEVKKHYEKWLSDREYVEICISIVPQEFILKPPSFTLWFILNYVEHDNILNSFKRKCMPVYDTISILLLQAEKIFLYVTIQALGVGRKVRSFWKLDNQG